MTELADRVRALCADLPDAQERLSHGAPTWFWKGRRSFLMLWADGHHHNGFPHLWAAAPIGAQAESILTDPSRFFRPPYVGGRGWVGLRLDGDVDWELVGEVVADAYATVAG